MSCERTHDVDLSGFLAEPRAREFAGFREHYPTCVECSAELRAWTELHLQLRGPEAHPAPELLLRYQDERVTLAAEQRGAVASHLESCASCRDELRALGAFQPEAAAAPEASAGAWDALAGALRRWLWQPALAYALVLLLLVPLVLERWDQVADPEALLETPLFAAKAPQAADPKRALERAEAPARLGQASKREPTPKPPAPGTAAAPEASVPREDDRRASVGRRENAPAPQAEALHAVLAKPQAESDALGATGGLAAQALAEPETPGRGRALQALAPALELRRRHAESADATAADVGRKLDSASDLAPVRRPRLRKSTSVVAGEAGAPPALRWTREGDSLAVQIPHPPLRAGERALEVRILHADGRRQLVERLPVDPTLSASPVQVPAAWLGPGPAQHRVELTFPTDPPDARRVLDYVLIVP